ncbi:MAG: polysaccharide deacetylase family protein [Spirochaetes bacterium]|nr:polysaccharide deacetylase family protein [Spirochaetota bacterium]
MKNIVILLLSLALSLAIALSLYLDDYRLIPGGKISWLHKERETRSRLLAIPILLYHNIDGKGPFSIDSETLRQHFQLIKDRGIRVIPLKELIQRLEHPAPYREKVMVITFDDGYRSMHDILLPLAREFGYPVTLFVYTDCIYNRSTRNLTWDLVRKMDRMGIDIQAHSISHPDLTQISKSGDPQERKRLFEEIYLARRIIELRVEKRVEYYAFPYGRYNLQLIEMAQSSGYRRAFSTDYGSNIITRDNFCLKRQHVKSSYSLSYMDMLIR